MMLKTTLIAALLCATTAAAECWPAEAGGDGSAVRKAAQPRSYNGVLAWTCADGKVEWVGVRDSADLALRGDKAAVRAHLIRLMEAHRRGGMADLMPLVELAR